MQYVINCSSFNEFMDCIEELTKRGLCFVSDAGSLTIKLTGGF